MDVLSFLSGYTLEHIKARSVVDVSGCWRWQNKLEKNGAGTVMLAGNRLPAHKASYLLAGNTLPQHHRVYAICGNRDCVAPDHLAVRPIHCHHIGSPDYIKANVVVSETTGCWEWSGRRNDKGYGVVAVVHDTEMMHRASYKVFVGPIPDGLFVLHRCDNPPCCNPEHLFLGTKRDNMLDAIAKGRLFMHDGAHHNARLSVKDVAFIRGSDLSDRQLAMQFGVTRTAIKSIREKRSWRHVA